MKNILFNILFFALASMCVACADKAKIHSSPGKTRAPIEVHSIVSKSDRTGFTIVVTLTPSENCEHLRFALRGQDASETLKDLPAGQSISRVFRFGKTSSPESNPVLEVEMTVSGHRYHSYHELTVKTIAEKESDKMPHGHRKIRELK